jgi:aminoglycoside 3-N-acetyltransferase
MQPERGNPSITVDAKGVCAGFRSVGAVAGDVLMYHGSLSSMGTVLDGGNTVIEGARLAVGPTGTVAMPTLWYHSVDPPLDPSDWDIDHSESYVGTLSETFRTHPESLRSDHFSHSVSAIGSRAPELVSDHGAGGLRHTPWGPRAFAGVSPWARLVEWNALYCFIGVTFRVLTLKHYMEAILLDEISQTIPPVKREAAMGKLSAIGRPGIWPSFNSETLEGRLADMGLVRYGEIGSATVRAIRARDLIDHGLPLLREAPDEWFSDAFLAWCREAVS